MGGHSATCAPDGPFRGSQAVAAGLATRSQLTGPQFVRVFRDVYVPATADLTHELRCKCAALALPDDAVITGRSAATLGGVRLALPADPVEAVVGLQTRLFRRAGFDLRRCEVRADEALAWSRIRLATRQRTAFDLLLDRTLPDAVADLDAVLRAGFVGRRELQQFLTGRHDRGIVQARRAVEFADPRAESRPESRMRVHLVLDGLRPEVQFRVYDGVGWVATVDLAFPRQRLAVEYDGVWHGAPLQVGVDRDRLNRLHAAGWEVVFVTAQHLRDPQRMVCLVRAALLARHAA
ncbi:MAG: endonuclease domain-containing protein [Pseudonocardiaceae bacterium]